MEISCFELPPIGTNAWLLSDPDREEAILFDAPLNAFATVEKHLATTGQRLTALLFTHGHWDHMLDGGKFNTFGTPTYAHRADAEFFANPDSMARFAIPGLNMPPTQIDHWLEHGQTLELLGQTIEVRHVPGHCPGSLLFWFRDAGFAISGDAIFRGSVGRTDFPYCSFEQLENSIRQQIYTLPGSTRILPGHGPETTVGDEAENNPFVRRHEP